MKTLGVIVFLASMWIQLSSASKILLIPIQGGGHISEFAALATALIEHGHDTYVVVDSTKNFKQLKSVPGLGDRLASSIASFIDIQAAQPYCSSI